MSLQRTWHTHAALAWLQLILLERFGHVFSLQVIRHDIIRLGRESNSSYIDLPADADIFGRADSELGCTTWNASAEGWHPALGKHLPAPGATCLPSPLIEQTQTGFRIHYNVLALTYWMLSRQEEIGRTDVDGHGRFSAMSSHAFKHGYLEQPVVDEWLHVLAQVIQKVWPALPLKQHRFSMKVSHDVDRPSRYCFGSLARTFRAMAGDVFKRGDLKAALLGPWVRLNSKATLHAADPANTFSWIMDVSERHGLRSAFYFICGRTEESKDADYELDHPAIRDLMRRIYLRGHEVGLHPSYNSYQTPKTIVSEAARLLRVAHEEGIEQSEWGGRMHFLRWEHPTTLNAWEQAGMTYDSSLSYADRPGFRCGTCFEYPAFDPVGQQVLRLRIRPLIAMECTVMAQCYLGLGTGAAAFTKFHELKNACKTVNGCFTLLWHNSEFDSAAKRSMYESVIQA
jgi:hypothetical protein